MIEEILDDDIQSYITTHLTSEIPLLLLQGIPFSKDLRSEIINQIQAKKRSQFKLPTWYKTAKIYFPKVLSIEQSSSEKAAQYKAALVGGQSLIDLTGGLGVDSYHFSAKIKEVIHCEMQTELSIIAAHNFQQLGVTNINCINKDGIEILKSLDRQFDWIYLDPARRNEQDKKVFMLSQCTPNVKTFQGLFLKYSKKVMIKTSPLLDISATTNDLQFVKDLHILAVGNEVKELLWILERDYTGGLTIQTINLFGDHFQSFKFNYSEESQAISTYHQPLQYLYEPNAAILKSGAFNLLGQHFNLYKLNKHSHLYTSQNLQEFPGRRFKIEKVLPYQKKKILKEGIQKANITTRNFPVSVQDIRKKLKIKDGGNHYLFFSTDNFDNKIVLICSKL